MYPGVQPVHVAAQLVHVLVELVDVAAQRQQAGLAADVVTHLVAEAVERLAGPAEQAPRALVQLLGHLAADHRFQQGAPVQVKVGGQVAHVPQQFPVTFHAQGAADHIGLAAPVEQQGGQIHRVAGDAHVRLGVAAQVEFHAFLDDQRIEAQRRQRQMHRQQTAGVAAEPRGGGRVGAQRRVDGALHAGDGGGGNKTGLAHQTLNPRCRATMPPSMLKYSLRWKPASSIMPFRVS